MWETVGRDAMWRVHVGRDDYLDQPVHGLVASPQVWFHLAWTYDSPGEQRSAQCVYGFRGGQLCIVTHAQEGFV